MSRTLSPGLKLPLLEKANAWGIAVKAVPGNYRYYGYFSRDRMEIALATEEESVFFHELAHAAHRQLIGRLEKRQCWRQEIIAELAAAALCRTVGKSSKHLGNNYKYIKYYASKANLRPVKACLEVLAEVEKVLGLILTGQ